VSKRASEGGGGREGERNEGRGREGRRIMIMAMTEMSLYMVNPTSLKM